MKYESLLERFIRYVKIDTQSDPSQSTIPTTMNQFDLANVLVEELKALGLNPYMDEYGFVSVLIEGDKSKEAIGFLAHMDTASDYSGKDVKPQVIENYQGQDIQLVDDVLSPKQFPSLLNYIGQTIVATDGTTLLGADDKAGVAIIMEMLKYVVSHPELNHGDIYAAFTIDEEGGPGVTNFNLDHFKPKFAYTVDGGKIGDFSYETFNAASLFLDFKGVSIHPGSAKNQMLSPMELLYEFHQALPKYMRPEYTSGYEGFYMPLKMQGNLVHATAEYLIRDHDLDLFAKKKQYIDKIVEEMQKRYPKAVLDYTIRDHYFSMKEKVLEVPQAIDYAIEAMQENGVEPLVEPIRGGTDGSKLSFMGIPTPNLFTGGHNAHGKYEYVVVDVMEKAVDVLLSIIAKAK